MIFNHLTRVLLLVAWVGMTRKGLHRRCWSFFVYVLALLACGSLIAFRADAFYAWPYHFWLFSRDLYAGLKVLVALEVGLHVFRAFPRAARTSQLFALWLLVGLLMAFSRPAPYLGGVHAWALAHLPVAVATLWLFASVALLVMWFNLPLQPWHRALLVGFGAQLAASTAILSSESAFRAWAPLLDVSIASWWAWSAWTVERPREARLRMAA